MNYRPIFGDFYPGQKSKASPRFCKTIIFYPNLIIIFDIIFDIIF